MDKEKIKAIIFDMDGVLIDATEIHYEALNKALGIFGYSINRDDHIRVYNGLPTSKKLIMMSKDRGLPENLHSTIRSLKKKFTSEMVETMVRPAHDKHIMLNELKVAGYKLAVCSNAISSSVEQMLECAGIIDFFDFVVGNDTGLPPKPAPDIYIAAFKELGIKPEDAVIVEDAPHGREAAHASGANVIEVDGYKDVNAKLFINKGLL